MNVSILALWNDAGGFARGIIVILAVMSVLSIGVAVAKWWRLRKSTRETAKFAPEFGRFLQEDQLDAAIALAEKQKVSHVARVLGEALAEVKPLLRDRATVTANDINAAERATERQMMILLAELKKGLAILATVGATSPFVGLLGTTMGIVNAFTGMAVTGSGGLAAISAGIAEALITTAFGLLVAIPAVWFYNYFQTRIEAVTVEMTYTAKELIDFLIKSVGSEFGRSIFTKEFQTQKATGDDQTRGVMLDPAERDPVLLGAAAPQIVVRGRQFTARFVAYVKDMEKEVMDQLAGLSPGSKLHRHLQITHWQYGTRVRVRLTGEHIEVEPAEDQFVWNGTRSLVEFDVKVPTEAPLGLTVLKFDVFIEQLRVARLRLDLEIASTETGRNQKTVVANAARTAFASYAEEDRWEVLGRIASVRAAAGLDVFLDCLSLRPGERWKDALRREIQNRDLFLLFWSEHARRSEWVEWEWRTAIDVKGVDVIQPHPLQPVAEAPPPKELEELHFGDAYTMVRGRHRDTP